MDSVRIQRRQDAVLSLQKVFLLLDSASSINGSSDGPCSGGGVCTTDSEPCNLTVENPAISFPCTSNGGFYCINYCKATIHPESGAWLGFAHADIPEKDRAYLIAEEALILQATPVASKGQNKDKPVECQKIYLSSQNNIYPASCVR